MKKPSSGALATARFENKSESLYREPTVVPLTKQKAAFTVSAPGKSAAPLQKRRSPFIRINSSSEQIKDFLFLIAAMLIISIIHRYIPNSGAVPHSIVDVVKSGVLFTK